MEEAHSKSFKRKQQKFDKKLSFYTKVKDSLRTLVASKDIKKKKHRKRGSLKAYDFSSLAEFLPDLDAIKPPSDITSLKISSKTKQKLVEKEGRHLKAVLSDPTFQSGPLSTIHQHILNTQPPVADKPKSKGDATGRKSRRKGRKAASTNARSMDIGV